MSRELPDYKRANRTVPCSRCGAEVGESCRTPRGRATYDHGARSDVTSAAFRIGVEAGLSDALDLIDWNTGTMDEVRKIIANQHRMIRRGNLRREQEQAR